MTKLTALLTVLCGLAAGQAFDLEVSAPARTRQGSPLLVETKLLLRQEADARVELKDGAAWTSALRIQVLDADGKPVEAEWELLAATGGVLAFGEEALEAGAVSALAGSITAKMAPGEYTLQARLDTAGKAADGAWSGEVPSRRVRVTVVAAESDWQPGEQVLDKRVRARWSQLRGDRETALQLLDGALELAPGDLDVVLEKADLLLEMERREEAVTLLETALKEFRRRYPGASHPPREILRRLRSAGA